MKNFRKISILLVGALLLVLLPSAAADFTQPPAINSAAQLPSSPWWLVMHDQCGDTLRWVNQTGEFAYIARPQMPNEAATAPCGKRAMHISQDGRYLVQTSSLTNGLNGVGFYDLQTGQWLGVFQTAVDEFPILGDRYSSNANNQIAVGFANARTATRAWRVVIFDMTTGTQLNELRSDGPEIAAFVGGEFLATELTLPHVTLFGLDSAGGDVAHIRMDSFDAGVAPLGALAWHLAGAPGVGQALVSSPYTQPSVDLVPDGTAIFTYSDGAFPAGPPVGDTLIAIDTNAVGLIQPTALDPAPPAQLFFADGSSTVYSPSIGADGRLALFRRNDGATDAIYWVSLGTPVMIPLENQAAQILGIPTGFVYNTATGIYYLDEISATSVGPVMESPILSGGADFVWATAYGNPPFGLNVLANSQAGGGSGANPPVFVTATPSSAIVVTSTPSAPVIITSTPDTSSTTGPCRVRSNSGNVNVRSGPSTDYNVVGQFGGITEYPVIGINGAWYVINYAGSQAWVASWVVTLLGECTGLAYVEAPPSPIPPTDEPTPEPGIALIEFYIESDDGTCAHIVWNVANVQAVYYEGAGVAGSGSADECPPIATTYTLTVTMNDSSTQTRTVTYNPSAPPAEPDLAVSEFSLDPNPPVQGNPVDVRVGVYNYGGARANGIIHVEWWAGENFPSPACTWDVDGMNAGGGRILTCTYAGYGSWYGSINTKVVVDTTGAIPESNEGNNVYLENISVSAAP